ncbi:uncharacterized protein LOC104899118 [Beta vulgaris subsp. vulgaris]|uniref:uncharacterized protein LOC104899118 n=1 Tax=Beta vulgaris subsp. vulgaris TaxID=3555 RepID=UPI00053FAC3F|nr:uncharacterized protein LOC104899118 [Beta vulgaris subsp. vulgaris]
MVDWAIITPLNEDADKINDKVVEKFLGEGKTYYSIDYVLEDRRNLYQQEFFNSISASGLPPHALTLKFGVPLMLLRNIDPKNGLCNAAQLLCHSLNDHFIDAEILTGHSRGNRVFPLKSAKDIKLPFELARKQFPVKFHVHANRTDMVFGLVLYASPIESVGENSVKRDFAIMDKT